MRGRKPTPTLILAARGSARARGRGGEPTPPTKAPTAPPHLSDAAKAEWRRIVPLLMQMNLIAQVDRAALAMYCVAYARWIEAETSLTADGVIVKAPSSYPIQNPYLAVSNKCMELMTRLLAEFGLSPASRTRVRGDAGGNPSSRSGPPRNTGGPPLLKIASA